MFLIFGNSGESSSNSGAVSTNVIMISCVISNNFASSKFHSIS